MYGLGTVALTKRQVAELNILSVGVNRNEYIRGTAQADMCRGERVDILGKAC